MRPLLALTALLAAGVAGGAPLALREDYQKKADEAPWQWSDERATLQGAAKHLAPRYVAEVGPRDDACGVIIRILKDGAVVHFFPGHHRTAFAVRDDILYYADLDPICSGCAVVAHDMRKHKRLWRVQLKGLGPVKHSKYRNAVNISLERDAVCVRGHESAGNYIEFVDLRTGKTVGHKVYPRK